MTTHVNIFKDEWCELLFNGRNQRYGAYEIRRTSGKRHLLALFVTISIFITGFSISMIHKRNVKNSPPIVFSDTVKFDPGRLPDPPTIKPPSPPSRPRSIIQYVPWVVRPDDQVKEPDTMTIDIIRKSTAQIGAQTIKVEGPNEPGPPAPPEITEVPATIRDFVEQMPQFPGGDKALLKYLSKKIVYPTVAIENKSSGTVFIGFVVRSDGQISNVEVARGFDVNCENEAIRVIKAMPSWIPGKQNGNTVNVRMMVPVKFRLDDN